MKPQQYYSYYYTTSSEYWGKWIELMLFSNVGTLLSEVASYLLVKNSQPSHQVSVMLEVQHTWISPKPKLLHKGIAGLHHHNALMVTNGKGGQPLLHSSTTAAYHTFHRECTQSNCVHYNWVLNDLTCWFVCWLMCSDSCYYTYT